MIKCQVCAYDNKDDAEFCLNCGSPLVKQKVSQAMDDVSEEQTVLIDPAAMQKRIQSEISKGKPEEEQPVAAAPAPAAQPAAQPAPAAASPPPAAPAAAAPAPAAVAGDVSEKDWLVTLILAFVVGFLGVHRFYVGKIGTGILQLVTLGGCSIWAIIDVVLIAMGKFTDADGKTIVQK